MELEREDQIRKVNETLKKWRGAHGQLWSYTASLATLEIRLFFDDRSENLNLICSPCISIASPTFWERSELVVAPDPTSDDVFILRDTGSAVCVLCRQLSASETVEAPVAEKLKGKAQNPASHGTFWPQSA